MRLLNVTTFELREFRQRASRPKYAILSHRWFDQEITFDSFSASDLQDGRLRTPQLDKIRGTCRIAKGDKLEWVWIDSCCINKDSSEELNRSLNSMFKWYQEAEVCYTYLSDVLAADQKQANFKRSDSGKDSEWFERGWTLQELIAPRTMKFFDKNWVSMGTRAQLAKEISSITGIEVQILDGSEAFRSASLATRLSWQARRKTTEEEDMVYGLLGLMGVSLVPTYGEGRQAFTRLQQELLKTYRDESIFAWKAQGRHLPQHDRQWSQGQWGLLAPWVDCFQDSRDIVHNGSGKMRDRPGGISITAGGVKFPMSRKELGSVAPRWFVFSAFLPPFLGPFIWEGIRKYRHAHRLEWSLTLNCWQRNNVGELKQVQIFLTRDSRGDEYWRRCRADHLGLVERVPSHGIKHALMTQDITIIQPTGVWWPAEAK
ncbi:MAG: hypothetical protein Q9160_004072 [Pyrenula sp. 1 TL-2023]